MTSAAPQSMGSKVRCGDDIEDIDVDTARCSLLPHRSGFTVEALSLDGGSKIGRKAAYAAAKRLPRLS